MRRSWLPYIDWHETMHCMYRLKQIEINKKSNRWRGRRDTICSAIFLPNWFNERKIDSAITSLLLLIECVTLLFSARYGFEWIVAHMPVCVTGRPLHTTKQIASLVNGTGEQIILITYFMLPSPDSHFHNRIRIQMSFSFFHDDADNTKNCNWCAAVDI